MKESLLSKSVFNPSLVLDSSNCWSAKAAEDLASTEVFNDSVSLGISSLGDVGLEDIDVFLSDNSVYSEDCLDNSNLGYVKYNDLCFEEFEVCLDSESVEEGSEDLEEECEVIVGSSSSLGSPSLDVLSDDFKTLTNQLDVLSDSMLEELIEKELKG